MSIFVFWFLWLFLLFFWSFIMGLVFLFSDYGIMVEYVVGSFGGGDISLMFIFDWVSMLFLSFVIVISSFVLLYSKEYMLGDKYEERFCLLVVLFVMSMSLLILSPSFVSLLLGWDGLGLVSYCLVIYYYNNKSYNAGMITIMMNRVGDVAILIGIVWFLNFGGWDLYSWNMIGSGYWIGLCVVLAAMTKSAQIPFSAWLPAAMAAPTPVSSLVHSSTLVTAGVYLLIRFNSLFGDDYFSGGLLLVSCMTLVMSGLGANFEYDLKKIVALSTLSQLGMMMMSLSIGGWKMAYFHMLSHAIFKSMLFLCSGSIIHGLGGMQDIRYMGCLISVSPMVGVSLNVANLSLMGFPFMSGFYSKDLIVEMFGLGSMNLFIYLLLVMSIGLTSCYSLRLSYYVMWGGAWKFPMGSFGDYSTMSFSIFFLSLGSVVVGSLLSWLLFVTPVVIVMSLFMKLLSLFMMIIGVLIGIFIWCLKTGFNKLLGLKVIEFLGGMWYLSWLSGNPNLLFYNYSLKFVESDLTWGEIFGGQGIYLFSRYFSKSMQWFQDNSLKLFMFSFLMWLVILFY
uniref:NADH-ubiquinone oxidoreductase chain 5 n=1 Tax=Nothopuga sp. 1 LP-2008 TaxID=504482 RepID=A9LI68_9ARAC|nr:NADH dehydrogenase subunit 5 [Nothopuga sp. 1 LP-2008]ABS71897.1 NADH dehydrogenase subunit 5 [Nothopuga sp. 1 LP-2008]